MKNILLVQLQVMAVAFSPEIGTDLTTPPPEVITRVVVSVPMKPLPLPPTLNWFKMERGWWLGDTNDVLAPLQVGRRRQVGKKRLSFRTC